MAVVDLDRHRAGDGLCGSGTIVVRAVGREGDGDGVGVGRAGRRVAHVAEVGRRNLRGGVDIAVVVVQRTGSDGAVRDTGRRPCGSIR